MSTMLYIVGGGFMFMGGFFVFFGINALSVFLGLGFCFVGIVSLVGGAVVGGQSRDRYRRGGYGGRSGNVNVYIDGRGDRQLPRPKPRKQIPASLAKYADDDEVIEAEYEEVDEPKKIVAPKRKRRLSQRKW